MRAGVARVIDALRHTAGILPDGAADPEGAVGGPPLRDARVSSGLPDLLDASVLVSERVRVSLLTPTVLLVVLGTASLVVAAALLASLRDTETRLMRPAERPRASSPCCPWPTPCSSCCWAPSVPCCSRRCCRRPWPARRASTSATPGYSPR